MASALELEASSATHTDRPVEINEAINEMFPWNAMFEWHIFLSLR